MTDSELMQAAAALQADAATAMQALTARALATPDGLASINARADVLRVEADRRARAGVRVRLTADALESRQIVVLFDALALSGARCVAVTETSTALAELLTRSLALVAQMADMLAAPERAAAALALAEADAFAATEAEQKRRAAEHHADMQAGRAAQAAIDQRDQAAFMASWRARHP
jgi:hypothetical protein